MFLAGRRWVSSPALADEGPGFLRGLDKGVPCLFDLDLARERFVAELEGGEIARSATCQRPFAQKNLGRFPHAANRLQPAGRRTLDDDRPGKGAGSGHGETIGELRFRSWPAGRSRIFIPGKEIR